MLQPAGLNAEQYRAFEVQRLSLLVADAANGKRILEWLCATPRPLLASLSATMAGSDLRPLLPRITAPTLVLGSWTLGRLFGLDRFRGEAHVDTWVYRVAVNIMAMSAWPGHSLSSLLWLNVKISLGLALVGTAGWFYRRALFQRKTGVLLGELRETEASWRRGKGTTLQRQQVIENSNGGLKNGKQHE